MKRAEEGPRRRRPAIRALRVGAWVIVALALAHFASFAVFAEYVARLKAADPPPADAIIVLTGGHFRLGPAVELLRAGKGKRLLISGVHPAANDRALRQATGADAPLFECCIDIDTIAADTAGNAVESARWMRSHGYASAILVTNNYHVPRSLLEMRRAMPDARILAYPVVNARIEGFRWLQNREVLRVLLIEHAKFVAAFGRGLLS